MKILISFFLLSLGTLQAAEQVLCSHEWKNEGKNVKLELVSLPQGCEFPEGNKVDCTLLRFTNSKGEIREGASPLRSGAQDYCLSKKNVEIFGPSAKEDPYAWILCKNGAAKAKIRLESSDKKSFKDCPYPKF